jgi:TolB-like protein/Flp pilus assembly protein TadD
LLVLVENSGRMLSKDELMKTLWPDSFVDEANLTQQISLIRKALGDGPGKDRYIVTVPGRGYRFAGTVTAERPIESAPPEVPAPPAPVQSRERQILIPVLAISVALLLLGLGAYLLQRRSASRPIVPRSLAVLPFQNLTHDSQSEFLGFSLADAIITKLGYINSLAVRPSYAVAKYRDQAIDIAKVAIDLRADTLLTGSYLRDADDLRITSQLVEVRTGRIIWHDGFDVKYRNLLAVQDNVTQQIIKGLKLSLSPVEGEGLQRGTAVDPQAYEYYLRGVDLYSQNEYQLAIKMLERSVEIDPRYALTWAHLGRAYNAAASFRLGGRDLYQKAQSSYEKALSMQPSQIDAEIYMANFFTDTGRPEQAVPLVRQALKTNPNHAEAHWELGYAYRFAGMLEASAAECEQARVLDPSVKLTSSALNAYLYMGRYRQFLDSLPRATDSAFIQFYRGFAEYYLKDWQQAARDFDTAFSLEPALLHAAVGKALSYGIARRNRQGIEILNETVNKIEQRGVGDPEASYKIAQAYAVLGDKVSALRLLSHSVETGFFSYPYMKADPLLDSLRKEPQFDQVIAVAQQRHEAFRRALF